MFFKKNQLANNPFCKTLTWVVIAAFLFATACTSKIVINTHPDILRNELKKGDIVNIKTKDDRNFERFKIAEVTSEAVIGNSPTASRREGPEQKILFSEIASLEKIESNPSYVVSGRGLLVRPGDLVRVSTSDGQIQQYFVGTLVALDAYTLFLENENALPLGSVTKLELYRGRKSNTGKGAFIGFVGGAGFGAALGATGGGCEEFGCPAVWGLIVGGLLGTLIGTIVGAAWLGDIWQEVPLENVRQSSLK